MSTPSEDIEGADTLQKECAALRNALPNLRFVDLLFLDFTGHVRGKRYPAADLEKLCTDGAQMPGAVHTLDVTGETSDPAGFGVSDGDPDLRVKPIPGTLVPIPWSEGSRAQMLVRMEHWDRSPNPVEPRTALARVSEKFNALNLQPVVALEAEFFLIDKATLDQGDPVPRPPSWYQHADSRGQVYGMAELDRVQPFLEDVSRAASEQGLELGALSAEFAPGQFEINLRHGPDIMRAVDEFVMLRRIIQATAPKYGCAATFMAKPYAEHSGSGLHFHLSLRNPADVPVFALVGEKPNAVLSQAIAGALNGWADAMALYAPNPNAYRRFRPEQFVPTQACWGIENRSAAIRIPGGSPENTRIEFRVPGADANPYLALAGFLAGVAVGISSQSSAPPAVTGNACSEMSDEIPWRWADALRRLDHSQALRSALGATLIDAYVASKRAELARFDDQISAHEYSWYLRAE
ncbi:MAG: glutamine synthetase family protein [Pseudomonadota bacterium]